MASPAIVLVLVYLWATVDAGNVPVLEPLTVSIVDGPRVVDGNNVVASFTSSRPSATLKCKLSGLPRIDCSSGNVIFENVDAGKHTLTVIARDGQDRASEKGVVEVPSQPPTPPTPSNMTNMTNMTTMPPTVPPTMMPPIMMPTMAVDLPVCPAHPFPSPLPSPLPPSIQQALKEVEDRLGNLSSPSIAASIVYRDQVIWSRGYGEQREGEGPPTTSTIYRIGSVSKVFQALLVFHLYDRGLVTSLDDPLKKYCPNFHINNPFTGEEITLRQILTYVSGLPREAPCTIGIDCNITTDEILQRLSSESLIAAPWTYPSYSNLAYSLPGHCLVPYFFPNMTYKEYITENILQPLGMLDTGFDYTDDVLARLATGYSAATGAPAPLLDLEWIGPAGEMYSTLSDLSKLARFFYSVEGAVLNAEDTVAPEVISPSLRRLMMTPTYIHHDHLTGSGYSWEVGFLHNYTLLVKGGNLDGYSALFSFVPELHLSMNIFWASSVNGITVQRHVYNILIPPFVKELSSLPPALPQPPNATIYEGTYELHLSEVPVGVSARIISVNGSKLILQQPGADPVALIYREPFRFQLVAMPSFSCQLWMLIAQQYSWIVFGRPVDGSGLSPSFEVKGAFAIDITFVRVP